MTTRQKLLVAVALAGLVVLSRLPFVTHELWQWDSVLYARALDHGFHVDGELASARPHPPGYIFYVGLAALFRLFLADANAALVAVSILGTALAAVAIFLLAERFAGPRAATIAAAGFAFNPLVWLYGEVAYPYTMLAFLMAALAGAFYAARGRSPVHRLAATALLGVAAGFRQDLLLLLLPLWLWMAWPGSRRERVAHVAALAVACLGWFVPSALLSGGLEPYLRAVVGQSVGVAGAYSAAENGLQALSHNLRFTLYALAWGLLAFGVLLAGLALAPLLWWLRHGAWRVRLHRDNVFFVLWLLPSVLFYCAVHIGEWGYVLSVLPGLYVLTAALLPPVARSLRGDRRIWRAAAAALVAAPALIFLVVPDARFSADALADHDRAIATKVAYIRATFAPDTTVVLAREDFLLVRYYLPQYRGWYYDPPPYVSGKAKEMRPPMRARTVVLFTNGLQVRRRDVQVTRLAPQVDLSYFTVDSRTVVEITGDALSVRDGR